MDAARKTEVKAVFEMFDRNNDGFIDIKELKTAMQILLGTLQADEDIELLFNSADTDRNEAIDLDEFYLLMEKFLEGHQDTDASEALEVFKVFDIDGDGFIDCHELKQALISLGENVTEEDLKALFRAADKNGDNRIDLEEFKVLFFERRDV